MILGMEPSSVAQHITRARRSNAAKSSCDADANILGVPNIYHFGWSKIEDWGLLEEYSGLLEISIDLLNYTIWKILGNINAK